MSRRDPYSAWAHQRPQHAHAPAWWERWADRHADQADRAMTTVGWVAVGLSIGYLLAHVAVAILRAVHGA